MKVEINGVVRMEHLLLDMVAKIPKELELEVLEVKIKQ